MSDEDRKEKLGKMLDALVKNNSEEAQVAFHDYLGDKMRHQVNPEAEGEPEPEDKSEE